MLCRLAPFRVKPLAAFQREYEEKVTGECDWLAERLLLIDAWVDRMRKKGGSLLTGFGGFRVAVWLLVASCDRSRG